jgi:hypothetical protein
MENEVSAFLKPLKHPLIKEIEVLRKMIRNADPDMGENIKWNGPNFHHHGEDRISMRINPTTQLQLILHRGAKVLTQPKVKLIEDNSGLLVWKGNDRAVITFKDMKAIKAKEIELKEIITKWLAATTVAK